MPRQPNLLQFSLKLIMKGMTSEYRVEKVTEECLIHGKYKPLLSFYSSNHLLSPSPFGALHGAASQRPRGFFTSSVSVTVSPFWVISTVYLPGIR